MTTPPDLAALAREIVADYLVRTFDATHLTPNDEALVAIISDKLTLSRTAGRAEERARWLKLLTLADDFKQEFERGSYMAGEEEARLRLFRVTDEFKGVARDGIEAQHGLNDTYPGDPYP